MQNVVLELCVNGERRRVEVDPTTPLLFVLRNDLGLLSPKSGCGLEQCGACTVLLAGEAVPTCRLPVGEVGDREVITLEGLEEDGRLHPLQQAFLDEQAAQCAYCVPGIIMAAAGLLAWNESPTREEIQRALAGHLCRCGAHARMLRAIARAGEVMRG